MRHFCLTLASTLVSLHLLLGSVVSRADTGAGRTEAEVEAQAEELITREPTVDDYGGFERCIDMKRIRTTRVLDERHVVVEMRNKGEYFVIQMAKRCPGLRKNRPVMTEPRGRQFCRFDTIRPMHDNGFGGLEPGMRCTVPGFQAVTKEQVVQLRESLELARKRERQERREQRQRKKAEKASRTS